MQALDLVEWQIGAGGVVGIGEKNHFGPRRHGGDNRIDIGGQVGLGGDHRFAPVASVAIG